MKNFEIHETNSLLSEKWNYTPSEKVNRILDKIGYFIQRSKAQGMLRVIFSFIVLFTTINIFSSAIPGLVNAYWDLRKTLSAEETWVLFFIMYILGRGVLMILQSMVFEEDNYS